MPLPIVNNTANMVNLAKQWMLTLDRKAADTVIPTPTLELMLRTLIEWGEPESAQKVELSATQLHEMRKAQVAAAMDEKVEDDKTFASRRW